MNQVHKIITTDVRLEQTSLFTNAVAPESLAAIQTVPEKSLTLDEKILRAVDAIKAQVVEHKRYVAVCWSGGKIVIACSILPSRPCVN